MNSIVLKTSSNTEKLPIGSGKIFGNSDVWEGFVWPSILVDAEEYDLTFMCQINFADATKYDTYGLLPKTGMLFFFMILTVCHGNHSIKTQLRVYIIAEKKSIT